jgi:hypothetical protein
MLSQSNELGMQKHVFAQSTRGRTRTHRVLYVDFLIRVQKHPSYDVIRFQISPVNMMVGRGTLVAFKLVPPATLLYSGDENQCVICARICA